MLFAELVATSAAVAATSSRKAKVAALAQTLRAAHADEIVVVTAYLSGELRQRQIGVGWASVRTAMEGSAAAPTPSLTVGEVDATLERIGAAEGAGSQAVRRDLLGALFAQATADEQRFLGGLLTGEVRQGALAGNMAEAIAAAADVPGDVVRRALLLSGDLRAVAQAALTGEAPGGAAAALGEFRLTVGRPLAPMLASPAASVEDAIAKTGTPVAVDWKLDGIRIQLHRSGSDVGVYTRSLDDITARVPEIVAAARSLPTETLVLDGEAIMLAADGRPAPFEETASRTGTRSGAASAALSPFFFDILYADGAELLDEPATTRYHVMDRLVPAPLRVPRARVSTVGEAGDTFQNALSQGHEGVVIKSLDTTYAAGRRGAGWLKVKPRHTLDLVVLAVEWGHGRRKGWLSNLHLGAREPAGGWVMLGKTFKGLTDEMLRWQTARFLELEERRDDWTVYLRPEQVVEIAFDGVQRSPRYPGGVALRFARVLRYRDDKPAEEADTIETVQALRR